MTIHGASRLALVALTVLTVAWAPSIAVAAPPANDVFTAPQTLEGNQGSQLGTSKESSKEAGEPAHAGNPGGASVWYRWTATSSARLTISTYEAGFDTLLAVYTGSNVDALTEVASNDDHAGENSLVSFKVTAGTEYRIAIDGFNNQRGWFKLRWRLGPTNDDFASAQLLENSSGYVEGTTWSATNESGEPSHAGVPESVAVWYRWTAYDTSKVIFFTYDDADVLAVYTGTSVEALSEVSSRTSGGYASISFRAVAGTQYRIAVGRSNPIPLEDYSERRFTLGWMPGLENDDFEDATVIEGSQGRVSQENESATEQPGEPLPDYAWGSIWYRWTAQTTGYVRLDTVGSWDYYCDDTLDTVLAVYTGDALASLTEVASNDDFIGLASGVSFRAISGTTYSISLSMYEDACGGLAVLNWYPGRIMYGSNGRNVMYGTPGRDWIVGNGGNDVIYGRAGPDHIVGGIGADTLNGGSGNDSLRARDGSEGNDLIRGGLGRDSAVADRNDRIFGVP